MDRWPGYAIMTVTSSKRRIHSPCSVERTMLEIMRRLEPFHVAGGLALAAAPTFAMMATLTGILDSGPHQMECSPAMHMSPLTGMVPMYALMSAFHSTAWLRLISRWAQRRRGRPHRVALCNA